MTYDKVSCISNSSKSDKYSLPCLSGKQIESYRIKDKYYIIEGLKGLGYKEEIFKGDRIYIQRIAQHPVGIFLSSKVKYSAFNTIYSIYDCKYDARFILGILNSRLMKFYYDNIYNLGMSLTTQVTIEYLKELPIYKINLENKKEKEIYDKIIGDIDEIQKLSEKDHSNKIVIDSIQNEINKCVEKLYGVEIPL